MTSDTEDPDRTAEPDDVEPTAELRVVLRRGVAIGEAALDAFGERLDEALAEDGAGEFEGAEFDPDGCVLYFATADTERTIALVRPLVARAPFGAGAEFAYDAAAPDGTLRAHREPV